MTLLMLRELDKVKKGLLELCAMVEDSVAKAIQSVERMDVELAREVIAGDDDIDAREVELDEECFKIIALYQPVAVDLRFLVAVMKFNNDLERIADLAANIAERAVALAEISGVAAAPFDFSEMAHKAQGMLKKSLDALVNLDVDTARRVICMDDEVDALHSNNFQLVKDEIRRRPEHIDALLQYVTVSRHVERIADLSTNIAEEVIYIVEGDIVRHCLP
ncbi:phosphate signaling complex protein PhoU [Geoalkalibacter halelectricus]|uniref:Phosphate-specific transport system accessory protein PhoU n=1 Tax=Geoalkalibacter halelectricus TaxID=2847045 RepID=A0ABY5ZLI5_9BACT|nr:phosphate signaling complex protein PhoU [Geoalkalibacter halelectricus]MDO3377733.1 phosphate signaling complex protein PhoU [Geoalkalibacter halelectricus]UWZ78670.1 phosphate signaling complex protein PhoU [Geoalkalibacter halelectricus]